MARIRFRPTWAELKAYGALVVINDHEFIKLELVEELLKVVSIKIGQRVEIPAGMDTKQFWTKDDYEKLRIPELILESRTANGDELDDDIVDVITKK